MSLHVLTTEHQLKIVIHYRTLKPTKLPKDHQTLAKDFVQSFIVTENEQRTLRLVGYTRQKLHIFFSEDAHQELIKLTV
jgi:hypothetical protein